MPNGNQLVNNKRMLELASQAEIAANKGDHVDVRIMMEKFAELIVTECVNVCKGQATYDPIVLPYKPSEQFASAIKKHFGVEQRTMICKMRLNKK